VPQLERAYRWLLAGHQGSGYVVRATTGGGSAAFRREGLAGLADTIETFRARHVTGLRVAQFSLKSDVPWLTAPAMLSAGSRETEILVAYDPAALAAPGVYVGTVTAWNPSDALAGPLFRLVNVVAVPYELADKPCPTSGARSAPPRCAGTFSAWRSRVPPWSPPSHCPTPHTRRQGDPVRA